MHAVFFACLLIKWDRKLNSESSEIEVPFHKQSRKILELLAKIVWKIEQNACAQPWLCGDLSLFSREKSQVQLSNETSFLKALNACCRRSLACTVKRTELNSFNF